MKNWLTPVVAGLLAVSMLVSCDKDETKATVTPSNAITVTASTASATLLQVNATQSAITYTWTPVSFTLSNSIQTAPPVPTYYIQLSKTADGFGSPITELNVGTNASKILTVSDLNALFVNKAGINATPGVATTVYARVVASLGLTTTPDKHTYVSEPVALTVTPYEVCVAPMQDSWSIIGPAGKGWNSGDDIDLTWSCTENAYIYTGPLNADEFKFRYNHDWAVNLGTAAAAVPTLGAGSVEALGTGNPPNLKIGTAGTYTLKLTVTAPGGTVSGGSLSISQ